MPSELLYGLPPIIGLDAQCLILGNMPSVMSLGAQQYYANPRNAFWRITGEIFGFDASAPYDDRTAALTGPWHCGVGRAAVMPSRRQPGLRSRPRQHGGQRLRPAFRTASEYYTGVLQRCRSGEELQPIGPPRTGSSVPAAAVDQPCADHALRRQAGSLADHWVSHDTVGRLCAHGRACSICAATEINVASSNGLPTIWIDVGRPLPSSPHGTTAAGCPVTLNIA